MPRFRAVGDLWIGPWFGAELDYAQHLQMFDEPLKAEAMREERSAKLNPLKPFHWELEFPNIFFDEKGEKKSAPGFDAVIGNPPWERINLEENEFFAARSVEIALAPKASERKSLIAALQVNDPTLWTECQETLARFERERAFFKNSGFYPLCGPGRTNLYAMFAEKALGLDSTERTCGFAHTERLLQPTIL